MFLIFLEKLRSSTFKSSCSSGWWWYRGHDNHNADYIELVGRSTFFQSLKGWKFDCIYIYLMVVVLITRINGIKMVTTL